MKCTNVLILDNCDDILMSEHRQKFLTLINTLVMRSKFQLHIVIVSQERLLYLDDFDSWTVKELNQSASIEMLDKIAPATDNETLREVAKVVEGCPLALKVIGQLLHIYGAKLMPKLKEEVMKILDGASIPKQRFRAIMDVAFDRLGILKDCGYVLSLFPGSFNEQAGTAIVETECLELYFKHSLLNEYSFAYKYRFKIHRLIKEYLQEKISIGDNTTFIIRFRAYFESLLLTHAMNHGNDKSETENYSLSLELHNLHYLKELLLTDMHLSSKELAVLGLISNIDLVQFEQLKRYYAFYIVNVQEVCPLLNNQKLCGKIYSTVVSHLYRICKCETIWAYLQNFFASPCMKYFQCKVATYLHDLDAFHVLHLSQDESSYIDIILGSHCNEGYRIDIVMKNHFVYNNEFIFLFLIMASILGPLLLLSGTAIHHFCMSCTVVIIGIVLCVLCACMLIITPALYYYEMAIVNTHHQFLRILEVSLKVFCYYAIFFIAIVLITSFILLLLSRIILVKNCLITISIIFLSTLLVMSTSTSPSLPNYCCQLIPVCI